MSKLTNSLRYLDFGVTDVDREDLRIKGAGTLQGVSFMIYGGGHYLVRLFMGGRRVSLGISTCGVTATKFADAARVHFWRYRVRNRRPPTEADMNWDLDTAKNTLSDPAVAGLLSAMETRLIQLGVLKVITPEDVASSKNLRDVRNTVRGDMNFRFAEVERMLVALGTEIAGLREDVRQLKTPPA